MDWESRAHPPVIPSQLSAKLSSKQWASAADSDLMDRDGLTWRLSTGKVQRPDRASVHQLLWEVSLQLKTEANARALIATGTLDEQADARLISLLGEKLVPFALKPLLFQASQEEEAMKLANLALSGYLRKIQEASLTPIKRQLIGRFINEQLTFREHE